MSLGNQPGAIAFTLIPCRAHFHARSRVSAMTPPFVAWYGSEFIVSAGAPCRPATDAMLTILPPPFSIIVRPTACAHRKTPVRFTSTTFCQPLSGMSSGAAPQTVPALLTRMSTRPNSWTTRATIASTDSWSLTSTGSASARVGIAAAASSQRSTLRAQSTSSAPASASPVAIWRPIPLPPPVTIATLPLEVEQIHPAASATARSVFASRAETSSEVAPDSRQAASRSAIRSREPDERDVVDERVRNLRGRVALLPVEEEILDLSRLVLVPVAREEAVVEVLPARAHAADVERVVRLQRVAPGLHVVGRERRRGRRDVEAVGRAAVEREDLARTLRREEERDPAVADLERELDGLRRDRREVDRDLGAQRTQHQLQRLAEPGRAVAGVRDLVLRAVVLERLAAQRLADDLDVLARLRERLPPRLAVPALDDLRAGGSEPEQEAAAREQVERRRGHRRVRGRAAGDLHDRAADLDVVVVAASHERTVTASVPQASAAHAES